MSIETEANKLVDKFLFAGIYFTDGDIGAYQNAKQCAIKHCELMIEELARIDREEKSISLTTDIAGYYELLNYLKTL